MFTPAVVSGLGPVQQNRWIGNNLCNDCCINRESSQQEKREQEGRTSPLLHDSLCSHLAIEQSQL